MPQLRQFVMAFALVMAAPAHGNKDYCRKYRENHPKAYKSRDALRKRMKYQEMKNEHPKTYRLKCATKAERLQAVKTMKECGINSNSCAVIE